MKNPRIPPPIIGAVSAGVIFSISYFSIGPSVIFPMQPGLALMIAAVGIVIEAFSVASFIRARTTVNPLRPARASSLVISGVNKISRNPMYLGMLLLLTAFAAFTGFVIASLPIAFFMAYITHFQIKPEETALLQKFGDEYASYMARVRRWI